MAERLKDMFFTPDSMDAFAEAIHAAYPEFDTERFKAQVFDESFEGKEVKDRMSHTTRCLRQTLPAAYPEALEVLVEATPHVKGFEAMCLPDFIEQFGLEDWDRSAGASRVSSPSGLFWTKIRRGSCPFSRLGPGTRATLCAAWSARGHVLVSPGPWPCPASRRTRV